MQFQLPQNLQVQLLSYDPSLKKLAQANKTSTYKKPKYPLGNVNDLIPDHIVTPDQLQAAVDTINSSEAPHRYHLFKRFKKLGEPSEVFAIIYHYESMWIAAWLPNKEDKFLYGYAIAHRDNEKQNKSNSFMYERLIDLEDTYTPVKYGRSFFRVTTQLVTIGMIDRCSQLKSMWTCSNLKAYREKSQHVFKAVEQFEEQLFKDIPVWKDDRYDKWSRINPNLNSIFAIILEHQKNRSELKELNIDNTWVPTPESLLNVYIHLECESNVDCKTKSVISSPFFKKWLQEQCNLIITAFHSPLTETRSEVRIGYSKILHVFKWIKDISAVWPDTPIDYFQSNIDTFLTISNAPIYKDVINWLQNNMPVASYFQILNKFSEETKEKYEIRQQSYNFNHQTNHVIAHFTTLRDTLDMIRVILKADNELKPPKRWRITEFHDHVQAEAWKVKHENANLHQDLFPSPVKVTINDNRWTFFQPMDLHQLASWGQAVRNCIGSATTYADGIKKKQHFIVLALLNNEPRFTIQLKVDMGNMSVTQIAGLHNTRLSDDERDEYTTAFRSALKQREEQLHT